MPNPLNAPDVGCREMGATAFWCKSLYLSLSPTSRVSIRLWVLVLRGQVLLIQCYQCLYKFGCLRRLLITCELGIRFVMNILYHLHHRGRRRALELNFILGLGCYYL
jgi:hypothetical protein